MTCCTVELDEFYLYFVFHVTRETNPSHHHSMFTKHPAKTDCEPVWLVFSIVAIRMTQQTSVATEIFICLTKQNFNILIFTQYLPAVFFQSNKLHSFRNGWKIYIPERERDTVKLDFNSAVLHSNQITCIDLFGYPCLIRRYCSLNEQHFQKVKSIILFQNISNFLCKFIKT